MKTKFWNNASGSLRIDHEALLIFLKDNGFWSYQPKQSNTRILIKVTDKRVRQVTLQKIREFCWDYLESKYQFDDEDERNLIKNEFLQKRSIFNHANMMLLPEFELTGITEDKDKAFLFFENCILEITPNVIMKKSYDYMEGFVFETDIINFDYEAKIKGDYTPSGEYYEFLKDVTVNKNKAIQDQNLDSLITIIGYLLHKYKDPGNAKAIIIMDTPKDGSANGGTGKGIFAKALDHITKVEFLDGKITSFSNRFRFSKVKYGTRIIVFDDVPKTFDFETIFPLITEKAVIEEKYQPSFTIPFKDSPKILITTNYTVLGGGSSSRRRKVEFMFADTFNDEYTPEDKFGHLLFYEWSEKEWGEFYKLMAYCLKMFLKKGIIKPEFNVAERKLKLEASEEFVEFINERTDLIGEKNNKKVLYEEFYSKFPNHHIIELNTFTKWLKLAAEANGFGYNESHSNEELFIEFTLE